MKALTLIALFILAAAAHADEPLLIKSSGGGLTPVEYRRLQRCDLYLDRVEIRELFGVITTKETRTVTINPSIQDAIAKAAKEKVIETENGLCDAPGTYVAAGTLEIFSSGGCGSPKRMRTGPYSEMLRELIDQYCPLSYFFP